MDGYLTSEDAVYPAWFKYFVWRKRNQAFAIRQGTRRIQETHRCTIAPYPDIYREPLAQIADIYEKIKADNKNFKEAEIKEAFSKKFPNLYAELISKSLAASMENRGKFAANG